MSEVEGDSSEQLASNDSQDFDPTDYLIDEVLKDFQQRILGWLSVHGKGPLSRQEYLLFENLPKCLPAEYKVVRSANGIIEDVFTYNDFKSEFYQKIKAENRELLAPLGAKITSPTENIKDVLNEEELAKVENAVCRELLTETENYLDFYHDVVDRLNSDDLKEIYQKVKQFFARIGCDNFKSKDDEGIIPYCFWKDADEMVIPFAAGMVDAGYMEIEGLRNLPQFVNELRGNLYYLAYAQTIGSIRCSLKQLDKNQQAFDRVYEDLLAYNDLEDPSWREEFLRRAAANEIDELTEYFKDCRKVYEYNDKVGELIEIISTYDEIIEDVLEVYEGVEAYLGVLEKGDVEGWYARGKLTLQVGTVFIGVGTITKITKVKTVLNGLKQSLRSGSFSKFADDLLRKSKGGVDEVVRGAGKVDGLVGRVDNIVDDLAQASLREQDVLDELVKTNNVISDAGKKFWANHEINVTRYLRETSGNSKVGRQITIDVTLTNGQKFTCRLDNLIDVGNNRFRIVDAKSSVIQDLSDKTVADLINDMSTRNQKLLYDGLKSNTIQQIKPRGDLAKQFFGDNLPNNINIEKSVDFFVNDTALEGYGIFKKILTQ